jgi:hypothetical protein
MSKERLNIDEKTNRVLTIDTPYPDIQIGACDRCSENSELTRYPNSLAAGCDSEQSELCCDCVQYYEQKSEVSHD